MALTKVTTGGITDATIATADIANNAITAAKLASGVQTTINNNADNRVITGSGTANTLNAESGVVIDSSGRLLLGTTTEGQPSADDLTIATSGTTGMTIRSGTSGNGNIFFSDGTSGDDGLRGYIQYNHSSNFIRFATDATERMRIDSSGKVGIGTTSPVRHMHLNGSDSDTVQLHITNSTTGTTGSDGVSFALGSDESLIINQRESNHIALKTADTERMRIDSSGNVGIGTTSPSSLLNVNTPASGTTTAIEVSRTTHGTVGKLINSTGALEIQSNKQLILSSDPNQGMTSAGSLIQFNIDGSEKARISSGGGIAFNGDTATANHLNDYEEGTWTPTTNNSGGNGFSTVHSATYTKIGNVVYIQFYATFNSQSSSARADIGGFPFQARGNDIYGYLTGRLQGHAGAELVLQVGGGVSYGRFFYNNADLYYSNVSGYYCLLSGFYYTDS